MIWHSQVKVDEINAGKKKIISGQELNQPRHTLLAIWLKRSDSDGSKVPCKNGP
jgi:hypothetical protein